jgi:division protein CdvB (Snf7/Vps24/ESCRT-III family)
VKANDIRLASLIQHLIEKQILTVEVAKQVLEIITQQGLSLVSYLVKTNITDNHTLLQSCAEIFSLPVFEL